MAKEKRSSRPAPKSYLLEETSEHEILVNASRVERRRKYWWNLHFEFEYQRLQIRDQLLESLARRAKKDFSFDSWQRAVRWQYSLHPLRTIGSLNYGGGRFNVGDVDSNQFPMFQALYLAEDKDTALQETLGQSATGENGLSPREIALTAPASETIVSVSGRLDQVLDLTDANSLNEFVKLTKDFKVSDLLRLEAKHLGLEKPHATATSEKLLAILLDTNWRTYSMQLDLLSNSQILGQLVRAAQIDGILYLSKFTHKKCLAVFLSNFENSTSYVELDDEGPDGTVVKRVNSSNWKLCETANP